MVTAVLTSKGQVTVPKSVRDDLGLLEGQKIEFVAQNGGYLIRPSKHSISRLSGYFGGWKGDPISVEQMNDAIADSAAGRP